MTSILVIAKNSFLESIRGRKILQVLLIVTLLVIAWVSTLNVFALGVQVKFIKDICLSAISIFGTLITLAVSCGQIPSELENRTIYPLLAKPVQRHEIIIGKFIGALYIIFLNVLLMSAIFIIVLLLKEHTIDFAIIEAIYLIAIELTALFALCIGFSTFFSTAANVTIVFFIYIFGHVKIIYINYLLEHMGSPVAIAVLYFLKNPILPPNLENFNIKEAIIWGKLLGFAYLGPATLYGILLILIYLALGYLVFRKKNL
jgi:ABC-type transport system involved in multi-copper enzyme maturation permease subunit